MIIFFDFKRVGNISDFLGGIKENFSKEILGHKALNFENFRKFINKGTKNHYF